MTRSRDAGIRYAQCWEDHHLPEAALGLGGDRGTVLSVCSGGCNSFALALQRPGRIVAVDVNPAQVALARFKAAAIQTLDWPDFLIAMGLRTSPKRPEFLRHVLSCADHDTRAFFERHDHLVLGKSGLLGSGRYERYLGLFRERVLPLVHPRSRVSDLLQPRDFAARDRFYDERWDSRRWRLLFRLFFSRRMMARLGRSDAAFAHVSARNIGDQFLLRARRALVELSVHDNPYIEFILTGSYADPDRAHPYLSERGHAALRDGLADRVTFEHASLEQWLARAAPASVDAFNLSDVFEWMSAGATRALLEACARAGRPGARLCYFNLLVPRRRPPELAGRLASRDDLARPLHARDRSFVWGDFVVEEVQA